MTVLPPPDVETAMVLGIASTALPFAGSPEAEVERWLRILRMHGEAGAALQAIGVSEAPLEGAAEASAAGEALREDVVGEVTERAVVVASRRGARQVGAGDVLVAVMDVYGSDCDAVLQAHGTDREEVLCRLALEVPPPSLAG